MTRNFEINELMNKNNMLCFKAIGLIRICLLFPGLFWLGVFPGQATRYVVPSGTAGITSGIPYNAWTNAATNIQLAVDAAGLDETVWVTNGEFCVTNQITITNRIMLQGVNGYSNTLVYADWPTWTTRCFYVTRTGMIDGFTISNGHRYGSNNYSGGGGAYVASNGIIQNCYFVNNICSNAGSYAGGGGAYNIRGVVSNCWFVSNMSYSVAKSMYSSGSGGGIMVFGDSVGGYVLNCTVVSNWSSGGRGGGIYSVSSSTTYIRNIISNCLIAYNYLSSGSGGGVNIYEGQLIDCIVSDNTSAGSGGGVNVGAGCATNCRIVNNSAPYAAGILVGERATVSDCVIAGNRVTGSQSSGGGGVYLNGGDGPTGIVERCWISNNICDYSGGGGGGVIITNGGTLRNCLIHHNTNMSTNFVGGGVLVTAAATNEYSFGVLNCTIVDNFSTNEGGGIATQYTNNYLIANCVIAGNRSSSNNFPDVYNTLGNSNIYYNCCATNVLFAPHQGNITSDPRFIDAANRNWRLKGNSPCINAGANQDWMTNTYDLDGRIRIRYGTVDMGTYEGIFEGMIGKVW